MKRHIIISLLMLCGLTAMAQVITVKGTVIDEIGEPVIGATVKATESSGTVTDLDGNFTLTNVVKGQQISISYVGYKTSTVIADEGQLNITLQPDNAALDEVVVVGYGATKKSNISGSVSTVKVDELPKAGAADLGTMLRGRAAGVDIRNNGANPGASYSINIRGNIAGQKPLIVIDGVPMVEADENASHGYYSNWANNKDTGLSTLNPDDIETVNILKDASAASIYGSKASGGVILITTKKGKTGKPDISYTGSVALQFTKDKPDYMGAKEFMQTQNDIFDEMGQSSSKRYTQSQIDNFVGKGTNWFDEVTRTGVANDHNLSVNGGSDKTHYLFSFGLYDVQGIAKNNSMNRITGRINLDQQFSDYFKAGVNASFIQMKYKDVPLGDGSGTADYSSLIYGALTYNPTVPVYNADGSYADNTSRPNVYPNPVSLLDITDQTQVRNFSISGWGELKLLKDLTMRGTLGYDTKDTQSDTYIPTTTLAGKSENGKAAKRDNKYHMQMANITATYAKKFIDIHDLSVMAGWEFKKQTYEGMQVGATNFPRDEQLMNDLGASLSKADVDSWKGSSTMSSWFGRINYTLLDRYILTANLRGDGSSNFSENKKWGWFPGISVAWRLNEEKFLKETEWLSNLKLRIGYGSTGNPGSIEGNTITTYGINSGQYVVGGNVVNGMRISKLGNPDLSWETLTDFNLGIDFGFFRNRISGTIEYYNRRRSDIIMWKQLRSYNEVTSYPVNSSAIKRSRGIDFNLHTVNITNKKLEWTTDINFSYYRNTTIARDPDEVIAAYQSWDYENDNNLYLYKTNGLIQPGESYSYLPNSGPGAIKYLDVNGYKEDTDGSNHNRNYIVAGADGKLTEEDLVYFHNSTPLPFSINNTVRWKNWDFNVYLYGSLNGWKVNNVLLQAANSMSTIADGINTVTDIANRWTYANQGGTMPGVAENNSGISIASSDYFYEKAWYLRLDNVSVGYTFPTKWFGKYIKHMRAYLSGRNLCVFSPYKGMDPETSNTYAAYPSNWSLAFGLNVKF